MKLAFVLISLRGVITSTRGLASKHANEESGCFSSTGKVHMCLMLVRLRWSGEGVWVRVVREAPEKGSR